MDITYDVGIPIPKGAKYIDLRDRVHAACRSIDLRSTGFGPEMSAEEIDKVQVTHAVEAYAANPQKASKDYATQMAKATPATFYLVREILDEFATTAVNDAVEIRNLCTNKLLLETESKDPRIRLKAIELLGKISDVGLFTDKSEVVITHRTEEQMRESLREKLQTLKRVEDDMAEDATYHEVKNLPKERLDVDLDEELG